MSAPDAIRVGLELIDAGWIAGVPLPGDDEIKTINGLCAALADGNWPSAWLQFMLELEADSRGDPDADVDAATIGERLGWTRTARVARIEAWALLHPRPDKPAPPEALRVADEIRELAVEFSAKCAELRAAMKR